jgi:hypothetical protein
MREVIGTAEAAKIIGITREGVNWLARTGRLKAAIVLNTGQKLFARTEVLKFAKARRARIANEVLERAERTERVSA